MPWDDYWKQLLKENKLVQIVDELNYVDEEYGRGNYTEQLCRIVYEEYEDLQKELYSINDALMLEMNSLGTQVYLRTSRVKEKDSLIIKIIRKRYKHIDSKTSKYVKINKQNYKDIITDLVGLRLIISYREKWEDIHRLLLEKFPLMDYDYGASEAIPHRAGINCQAEIPKAYYVPGDDITGFQRAGIEVIVSTEGYRSLHYIVSYQGTYVEIQLRSIYAEAWCECSHSYVYKHEANSGNRMIKNLSVLLSELTDAASDVGDLMRDIYRKTVPISMDGQNYKTDREGVDRIESITERIKYVSEELEGLKNRCSY